MYNIDRDREAEIFTTQVYPKRFILTHAVRSTRQIIAVAILKVCLKICFKVFIAQLL